MAQQLGMLTLVVSDYDEAISWYTDKLDFTLLEDTDLGNGKRWVRMAPTGNTASQLLLAKATSPAQQAAVGNQTGGRVFLFLYTDDFQHDYERMNARGVHFIETPRQEPYGTVVVFQDLYGNKWDFIERVGNWG